MIGVLLKNINIRAEAKQASQDMGDLYTGDLVIGTLLNGWIAFDGIYRKASNYSRENLPTTRYAAVANPTNLAEKFMALIDLTITPTPQPAPTLQPLEISIGGEGYNLVTVELRPIE